MEDYIFKKLDTFYAEYGYEMFRWVIKEVGKEGVIVTTGSWLKSSGIFLSFDRLKQDKSFCRSKPYSKLRWLLKF